jgi:hypothetical protein
MPGLAVSFSQLQASLATTVVVMPSSERLSIAVRSSLACAVLALAAVCATACGGGAHSTPTSIQRAREEASVRTLERDPTDRDDDRPGSRSDPDNDVQLTIGRAASAGEARAIGAMIDRYYWYASASDIPQACALQSRPLLESLVEEHSRSASASPTAVCVRVLREPFRERHLELEEDAEAFTLAQARVSERSGVALVRFFAGARERLIQVRREGSAWRMNTLFDNGAP